MKKKRTVNYSHMTYEMISEVTFRDTEILRRFTSSQNKILPRRKTGLSAKAQRHVTHEIKRARELGLMPYRGQ